MLGPSIEKLFQYTTLGVRGFSPLTVLLIAEQMIDRLEVLSNFNIVHGDIQPGNILLGRGDHNSTVRKKKSPHPSVGVNLCRNLVIVF